MKLFKRLFSWSAFPALAVLILVMIVNSFFTKNAWSRSMMVSFLQTNTMTICVCVGVSVVILTGGIDISLGALVSMCNVMMVKLMGSGVPYYWAVFVTLLAAVAGGALNGAVVSFLGVTPLLTTFATSIIFAGLALIIMPGPGGSIAKALSKLFYSKPLGIPVCAFLILFLFAIWKVYRSTPGGLRLYAVGCSEDKAFLSGINVKATKMFAYCFAGLSAGIGALAVTGMIGAGDPLVGSTVGMKAISAAVIGGVSLSGGKGDISGGIFGCLFLGYLTNLIVAMRFDAFAQQLLTAVILLFGVVIAVIIGTRENRAGRSEKSDGAGRQIGSAQKIR